MKEEKRVLNRHKKELNNVLNEKTDQENISQNPSTVVANLSTHVLTNEEYNILKFGVKYELATCRNESKVLAYAEDIWEQIDKADIWHNEIYLKAGIKNSLRGLAFNIVNIEDSCIFKNSSKI